MDSASSTMRRCSLHIIGHRVGVIRAGRESLQVALEDLLQAEHGAGSEPQVEDLIFTLLSSPHATKYLFGATKIVALLMKSYGRSSLPVPIPNLIDPQLASWVLPVRSPRQ